MTDPRRCKKCNADLEETFTLRTCQGCGQAEDDCECYVTTMNPSYDSDKLGWKTFEVEYGEPNYSFNTLKFWRTKDGVVLMAHAAGCSCPAPFEDYEGATETDVIQKLERVGSLQQAKVEFESHHEYASDKPNKSWAEVQEHLQKWGLE